MLLCAAGDIHGGIDRLYADVLAFEASLDAEFAWVLHVGDFGVWPDPNRVDGASRRHDGAGDFPAWAAERRTAPRRTLFIKGNHEDFVWLDAQPTSEVLPGLHYLRNGTTCELAFGHEVLRVGGIGGCHVRRISSGPRGRCRGTRSATTRATRSQRSARTRTSTSSSRMTRPPAWSSNGTVAAPGS